MLSKCLMIFAQQQSPAKIAPTAIEIKRRLNCMTFWTICAGLSLIETWSPVPFQRMCFMLFSPCLDIQVKGQSQFNIMLIGFDSVKT